MPQNSSKKGFVLFLTNLGHLWTNKGVLHSVQIAIFLIIAQIGLVSLFFSSLPPQIPLFYSLPWGKSQLASPFWLFLLPGISLLFLIINTTLAAFFLEERGFLSNCLSWATTIAALFFLIDLVKIITIVL